MSRSRVLDAVVHLYDKNLTDRKVSSIVYVAPTSTEADTCALDV